MAPPKIADVPSPKHNERYIAVENYTHAAQSQEGHTSYHDGATAGRKTRRRRHVRSARRLQAHCAGERDVSNDSNKRNRGRGEAE